MNINCQYIPQGSNFQYFITVCFDNDDLPYNLDYKWYDGNELLCTTPVKFQCVLPRQSKYKVEEDVLNVFIFPNPSNTKLNLQINNDINTAHAIIYSSDGKKVHASNLNFFGKTTTLDIGNLADGLYILQLQTDDGVIKMLKFVKMN